MFHLAVQVEPDGHDSPGPMQHSAQPQLLGGMGRSSGSGGWSEGTSGSSTKAVQGRSQYGQQQQQYNRGGYYVEEPEEGSGGEGEGKGEGRGGGGVEALRAQLWAMQHSIESLASALAQERERRRSHSQGQGQGGGRGAARPGTAPASGREGRRGASGAGAGAEGSSPGGQARPATSSGMPRVLPGRKLPPVPKLRPPAEEIEHYPRDVEGRAIGDMRGFWKP